MKPALKAVFFGAIAIYAAAHIPGDIEDIVAAHKIQKAQARIDQAFMKFNQVADAHLNLGPALYKNPEVQAADKQFQDCVQAGDLYKRVLKYGRKERDTIGAIGQDFDRVCPATPR